MGRFRKCRRRGARQTFFVSVLYGSVRLCDPTRWPRRFARGEPGDGKRGADAPASALSRLTAIALITLFLGLGLGPVTVARAEVDAAHASSGRQGPRGVADRDPRSSTAASTRPTSSGTTTAWTRSFRAVLEVQGATKALTQDQERRRYLSSASLASYLGIQSVKAVHVPVPVYLILVGFSGEGHVGLKLDHADLVAWLEHADHMSDPPGYPRRRTPRGPGEISIDPNTGKRRRDHRRSDGRTRPPRTAWRGSALTCHVVDVGVKVTAVLERAMRLYSRPLRPVNPLGDETRLRHSARRSTAHHVDAEKAFSALVDDLVADLDLTDSYTLVVMNPRRSNMGAKYGYGEGFSDDEAGVWPCQSEPSCPCLCPCEGEGRARARADAPS